MATSSHSCYLYKQLKSASPYGITWRDWEKNIIIPVHWWERGLGAKKETNIPPPPIRFLIVSAFMFSTFWKVLPSKALNWRGSDKRIHYYFLGSIKEAIINEPLNYILSRKGDVLYIISPVLVFSLQSYLLWNAVKRKIRSKLSF